MTVSSSEAELLYNVVVNDEGQYSVWPTHRAVPPGWREDGFRGSHAECLAHVRQVWTDMRPLSLRRVSEKGEAGG